ncbi:hypothetical protein H3V53_27370 [Paraburkholderia bengalensis]|uniref:Uncharacterized protein n=1 Tax=Paraburkholderia bengalensis TaxID=2747562 RepID=A0ABU8IZT2_9BURK
MKHVSNGSPAGTSAFRDGLAAPRPIGEVRNSIEIKQTHHVVSYGRIAENFMARAPAARRNACGFDLAHQHAPFARFLFSLCGFDRADLTVRAGTCPRVEVVGH